MSDLRTGWGVEAYPVNNKWEIQAFFIDKEEAEAWKKVFDVDYPNMDTRVVKIRVVVIDD